MAGVFKAVAKDRMLNQFAGRTAIGNAATHVSLHSGYPATDGNELATPAQYDGRQAITFGADSSAGTISITNEPVFTVEGGVTVAAVGYYSAASSGVIQADDDVTDESFGSQGTYTITAADFMLQDP